MHDFSERYRGVAHFGLWAEEAADDFGARDAWALLCEAVRRCPCEDITLDNRVANALAWFEQRMVRKQSVRNFRKALDVHDPMQRFFAARDALLLLQKHLEIASQ